MSNRPKPDHEMLLMQRVLRELAVLPKAGRQRVLMYWLARSNEMPDKDEPHGPQQLDIEDRTPQMPPLRGAAAAA